MKEELKNILILLFIQFITFYLFKEIFGVLSIALVFSLPFLVVEACCYISEGIKNER